MEPCGTHLRSVCRGAWALVPVLPDARTPNSQRKMDVLNQCTRLMPAQGSLTTASLAGGPFSGAASSRFKVPPKTEPTACVRSGFGCTPCLSCVAVTAWNPTLGRPGVRHSLLLSAEPSPTRAPGLTSPAGWALQQLCGPRAASACHGRPAGTRVPGAWCAPTSRTPVPGLRAWQAARWRRRHVCTKSSSMPLGECQGSPGAQGVPWLSCEFLRG